jgi:hypothetical protein
MSKIVNVIIRKTKIPHERWIGDPDARPDKVKVNAGRDTKQAVNRTGKYQSF